MSTTTPPPHSASAHQDKDAFPGLTSEEIELVRPHGNEVTLQPGEYIFERGVTPYDFFVILEGEVHIIDPTGDAPTLITTHGPGEFSGEIDLLRGRPPIVDGIAKTVVKALRLTLEELRIVLVHVPTLGDKLLTAFQMRVQLLADNGFRGLRVFGPSNDPETLELREFLHRNGVFHTWMDSALPATIETLRNLDCPEPQYPVIACSMDRVHQKPSLITLAEHSGIQRKITQELYDVIIIGSGPSGLGAAVYAASEGLSTLVLDRMGPGGQAGASSKIENYAGFPSGLSGQELALRSQLQAMKFGAEITAPCSATAVRLCEEQLHEIDTCLGKTVRAKTVIVATGVTYRQLGVEGLDRLRNRGVYYAATKVESVLCQEKPVHIIGAGNSAGQAAMFLSQCTEQVNLVVRGSDLSKSMSEYLSSRVLANPRIQVHLHTELTGVTGEQRLETVTLTNSQTGESMEHDSAGIFIFIGARPSTDFLGESVARDDGGFILTGPQVLDSGKWSLERPPCVLETSCPGVFASGDCRSGTTKRVAFAIGDGALAVTCVHDFLGTYS